ncbi:hypothetical protein ACHAW6_003143, partial [Cyclotella cf. meneghiniana]
AIPHSKISPKSDLGSNSTQLQTHRHEPFLITTLSRSPPISHSITKKDNMSQTTSTHNNFTTNNHPPTKMSITARFLVFTGLPLLFGVAGLGASYLQTKSVPNHQIDFNRDFVVPCILVMLLVSVIGFKTGGFKVQNETVGIQDHAVKDGNRNKKTKKSKEQ